MVFAVVKKDGAGKRRPKQNATEKTQKKEKVQNSKFSRRAKNYGAIRQAVQRRTPRFAQAPKLTFLSEFKRVVWRVLDRTAKRCACYIKHPPQCQIVVWAINMIENKIVL